MSGETFEQAGDEVRGPMWRHTLEAARLGERIPLRGVTVLPQEATVQRRLHDGRLKRVIHPGEG